MSIENQLENDTASPVQPGKAYREYIRNNQKAVRRLLNYAITRPEFDVQNDFLASAIPILRKNDEDISAEEEIILMQIYNRLSKQLKPVTNDSLIVAERMAISSHGDDAFLSDKKGRNYKNNHDFSSHYKSELRNLTAILFISVLLFISLQTTSQSLSEVITKVDSIKAELDTVTQRISDLGNDATVQQSYQYQSLLDQQKELMILKDTLASNENDLTNQLILGISTPKIKSEEIGKYPLGSNMLIHLAAKEYLLLLSYYLIPFVLGGLGASAYMVRHTLNGLSTSSYVNSSFYKHVMRLLLGAVLGVIGPLLMVDRQGETAATSFSPIVIALLMGYSIEFAFSLFDSTIERAREWANSLRIPDAQVKGATKATPDNTAQALVPEEDKKPDEINKG